VRRGPDRSTTSPRAIKNVRGWIGLRDAELFRADQVSNHLGRECARRGQSGTRLQSAESLTNLSISHPGLLAAVSRVDKTYMSSPWRRVAITRVLSVLVVAAVAATLLNVTVGLGGHDLSSVVLPVLGEMILGGAVVAIGLRAIRVPRDRAAWTALGLGAFFWMAGDVYRAIAFPEGGHRYYPSLADAGYLLLYPCVYVGLWLLIRGRAERFQRSLWLDGLIGATGVGAVGASLLVGFVVSHVGGSFSTVATNVAYPLADVLLLAQLVAATALSGWRPGRAWLFVGIGLLLFSGADAVYAYTSATGHTYVLAVGPLWIIAFVLIAVGAWHDDRRPLRDVRLQGVALLAVPLLFALVATGLLAYGQTHHLPAAGAALAVATLVLVIMRTALTFRENLALLDSRQAALTDELTGLPNRRRLQQQIRRLAATTTEPALAGLLLVDLDGFKELNDTVGHHAGDVLLASLGLRFRALDGLDLVARLGGDEFAVLITGDPDPALLETAANKLHGALDAPFEFDDLSVHVRASIGGALYPEHGDNASDLMRHADVAMYHAKNARTGYEVYRPEHDLNSRDRLRLVGELRHALTADELIVYYQPKANAQTGDITGVEALIRWQHPVEGLMTPDRFLPIAESAGLMRQLTSYVLERALRQLAHWNHAGADLRVAVNLAMPNLLDLRLPDEVARLLHDAEIDPSRLVLEITENIVMADPTRILDVVSRVHALGVELSLDDFGVGASSLGYIKRLMVDELKIDRSFVMAMDDDQDSATIVRATIELAHRLGLRVVAEGVETATSREHLQAWGCDEIQGYLLGRPMTTDQLAPQLRTDPGAAVLAPFLASV
jgi:diguanylate cyclase (GGDEF)-like protein